jgi:hypothetical protein
MDPLLTRMVNGPGGRDVAWSSFNACPLLGILSKEVALNKRQVTPRLLRYFSAVESNLDFKTVDVR